MGACLGAASQSLLCRTRIQSLIDWSVKPLMVDGMAPSGKWVSETAWQAGASKEISTTLRTLDLVKLYIHKLIVPEDDSFIYTVLLVSHAES
jgi:hypothetical protein